MRKDQSELDRDSHPEKPLTNVQFERLLKAKAVSGEGIINALRAHLCAGLPAHEAWTYGARTHSDQPVPTLAAGSISGDHFDLLIQFTSFRGKELLLAMRAHLVDAVPQAQAIREHGANKAQFITRMKVLRDVHERAALLAKYYR